MERKNDKSMGNKKFNYQMSINFEYQQAAG